MRAPTSNSNRACFVQALGITTYRKNGGETIKSTHFYSGDAEIYMECRYRSTCAPDNPAMPIDIGFQLDGTTFHVSSSADSKKLTTDEYLAAGSIGLPATFTSAMVWPHSHVAGCTVDAGHALAEDVSDNQAEQPVIFQANAPEPAAPSVSENRPQKSAPGMTLTQELRFIGVKAQGPPVQSPAAPHVPAAAPTGTPPETARAPAQARGAGATEDEDVRGQLLEERQRAQEYLARLQGAPRGGDRPPPYEPHFPGIDRPVHLTSVPQMENYLRMVNGRLDLVNERAAQRASQGAEAPTPGAAGRVTAPVQPAVNPSPPGTAVATPKATLFGLRVPYRFTDVRAEVDSAVIDCKVSKAQSVTSAIGSGRAVVELNGQDRSGLAQATVQPFSGHA
ncbi:MAG TPA: hypothetical protein VJ997_05430, partial [Longimicrobiales bacterium]|nr:hypothetical protein [Longimicrobiales bacterium]